MRVILFGVIIGLIVGVSCSVARAHEGPQLVQGWNLVSGTDQYAAAFASEHQEVSAIYGYRTSGDKAWWEGFFRGGDDVPGVNDLTYLSSARAYWVYVTEPPCGSPVCAQPSGPLLVLP